MIFNPLIPFLKGPLLAAFLQRLLQYLQPIGVVRPGTFPMANRWRAWMNPYGWAQRGLCNGRALDRVGPWTHGIVRWPDVQVRRDTTQGKREPPCLAGMIGWDVRKAWHPWGGTHRQNYPTGNGPSPTNPQ